MPFELPAALLDAASCCEPEHAYGVARLSFYAASSLGLSERLAYQAGLVHDLGKLRVSPELLLLPRPLTLSERRLMREHPVHGEAFVREYWPVAPVPLLHAVRHHHERLGGGGYPDGLLTLPPLTALVAAADVYDALIRHRPYRSACTPEQAKRLLQYELLPPEVINAVLDAAPFAAEAETEKSRRKAGAATGSPGIPKMR